MYFLNLAFAHSSLVLFPIGLPVEPGDKEQWANEN